MADKKKPELSPDVAKHFKLKGVPDSLRMLHKGKEYNFATMKLEQAEKLSKKGDKFPFLVKISKEEAKELKKG
jgi:hypothetical protein